VATLLDSGMPVKTALSLINRVWKEIENELDANFDPETQVALAWFATYCRWLFNQQIRRCVVQRATNPPNLGKASHPWPSARIGVRPSWCAIMNAPFGRRSRSA
jgi:hypothetical protein